MYAGLAQWYGIWSPVLPLQIDDQSIKDADLICTSLWSLHTLQQSQTPPALYWAYKGNAFDFDGLFCTWLDGKKKLRYVFRRLFSMHAWTCTDSDFSSTIHYILAVQTYLLCVLLCRVFNITIVHAFHSNIYIMHNDVTILSNIVNRKLECGLAIWMEYPSIQHDPATLELKVIRLWHTFNIRYVFEYTYTRCNVAKMIAEGCQVWTSRLSPHCAFGRQCKGNAIRARSVS
jgi:hypothetical protein